MTTQIAALQLRRGTASAWTATNPILASGEWGYETDTGKAKLGDGASVWSALAYEVGPGLFDAAGAAAAEAARAQTVEASLAPLASPALTGNPTAPTQAQSDNSTRLATTAFVKAVPSGLAVVSVNPVAANQALALPSAAGGAFALTLTQNSALSITGAQTGTEANVDILLTQDATGGRTVTWPGSITWLPGAAPTLPTGPGQALLVSLLSLNGGTSWYGYYNSGQGGQPPLPAAFMGSIPNTGAARAYAALAPQLCGVPVPGPTTVRGVRYASAGTTSGNILWALYDPSGNKVVDTGAIAQGGANSPHEAPFTAPTALSVGGMHTLLYMIDNATGQVYGNWQFAPAGTLAAQGSLAAPATITPPSAVTNQNFPNFQLY